MPPTFSPVSSTIEDGTPLSCNSWDSGTSFPSRLQYHFPANITDMFLNSCIPPSITGALHVRTGPDAKHIVVDVEVRGQILSGDQHLEVCMMSRPGPGNYGLGIYNVSPSNRRIRKIPNRMVRCSPRYPPESPLDVLIHVVIPHNVSLASLCTHLPQFSQSLGTPNPPDHKGAPNQTYPLRIGSLSLGGPVSHLTMRMDEVKKFELDIDAPLRGNLRVSESLSVTSRSSDVSVNITLVNRGNPITVNLEADHAPIDTIVKIVNLDTHGHHTTIPFPVHIAARTTYAPLGMVVAYPSSSPPVALFVEAETELAPIVVHLPPAFQGTFNLSAIQSDARVDQSTVADPSGKGRTRTVYVDNGDVDDQRGDPYRGIIWIVLYLHD
ncbi:hypothetical protein BS47DRAFT_58272 [Hydnum rufescens UP504]|uniref:Uncharacterized protein n=1 Tax=Hydnum rufescens UP504 TaxID=1448309 RepID=A0A9P6ARJ6_9AGAM|nr:hypothetical protein BS47DRAFT_58272 [Hydnum rufescens UP504]